MGSLKIEVDLLACSPSEIAKAAKFMLQFAGFEDPSAAQTNRDSWVGSQQFPEATGAIVDAGPRGSLGEEAHDDNGTLPAAATAFAPPVPDTITSSGAELRAAALPATVPLAAPVPPPPPGIEVDAQGVPWDQRIHSGSRAKVADGTWRQKRNLDPEVYKAVMDELRHTMGVERRAPQPPAPVPPVQAFAPVPPVPPIPVATEAPAVPTPPFAGNAAPPAPPISPIPSAPASAGAATGASPGSAAPTFPQLMQKITAGFHAKTITQQDIQRAVAKVGLTALPMLAARPDLVPEVATELGVAL